MERNAKRTGLNCWTDIKFAKKMLKKQTKCNKRKKIATFYNA